MGQTAAAGIDWPWMPSKGRWFSRHIIFQEHLQAPVHCTGEAALLAACAWGLAISHPAFDLEQRICQSFTHLGNHCISFHSILIVYLLLATGYAGGDFASDLGRFAVPKGLPQRTHGQRRGERVVHGSCLICVEVFSQTDGLTDRESVHLVDRPSRPRRARLIPQVVVTGGYWL